MSDLDLYKYKITEGSIASNMYTGFFVGPHCNFKACSHDLILSKIQFESKIKIHIYSIPPIHLGPVRSIQSLNTWLA